tara:strand:- start:1080 stop:1379 length:300 start_codon:yes stop_codon:yes gene_type:complete
MKTTERKLHKEAIEAIGMIAPTAAPMRNKLNRVMAHSDDPKLRDLVAKLLDAHRFASHTPATPIAEQSRCKGLASELRAYCRSVLERGGSPTTHDSPDI